MGREILHICTFLLLDIQTATVEEFQKSLQRSNEKIHLPEIIVIASAGVSNGSAQLVEPHQNQFFNKDRLDDSKLGLFV